MKNRCGKGKEKKVAVGIPKGGTYKLVTKTRKGELDDKTNGNRIGGGDQAAHVHVSDFSAVHLLCSCSRSFAGMHHFQRNLWHVRFRLSRGYWKPPRLFLKSASQQTHKSILTLVSSLPLRRGNRGSPEWNFPLALSHTENLSITGSKEPLGDFGWSSRHGKLGEVFSFIFTPLEQLFGHFITVSVFWLLLHQD